MGRFRANSPIRTGTIIRALLVIEVFLLLGSIPAWPQTGKSSSPSLELEVKAAFVYNFSKFTEWPDQSLAKGAPITIGLVGDEEMLSFLRTLLAAKTFEGRGASVVKVKTLLEAKACQILFFSGTPDRHSIDILTSLKQTAILTVGESDAFTNAGGMLQLTVSNSHVRFDANLNSIERSGLKVSSNLLKLARPSLAPLTADSKERLK